jgi:hypothetical protein
VAKKHSLTRGRRGEGLVCAVFDIAGLLLRIQSSFRWILIARGWCSFGWGLVENHAILVYSHFE